jgi:molybdopterin-guanine dinucleotide biosynthesis protein A
MSEVVGCILAGGLARRMGGGDKGLIALGGRPILERVIERFRPQVQALVLNANGDPRRFEATGLSVVPDSVEGFAGPLAGVLAALEWTKARAPGAEWVATAATDTPFFPRDLVARLLAACRDGRADLAAASSHGRAHPVFGLWPVRLAGDLRRAMTEEGVRKVDVWTARHRLALVDFPANGYDPFFNANTPADVAEAEALLEAIDP